MSMQTKPSIVFGHGIWADGSSFGKVIPTLQAEGYEVVGAQHSLDTLKGDVATVTRTLGRVSAPAVLVGHSCGGTVITVAGTSGRVAGLVYIAALAPDDGETSQSQQNQFPVTDIFSHIDIVDGRVWMLAKGVACFAGDLSEAEQRSSGRPTPRRPQTCSTRRLQVPPGSRSRAGTSWPRTTARSNPTCSASWRSGWPLRSTRSTAATSPCSRIPAS
jgi:pimeloyl-ACP methyl ester carboxylesterase